MTEIKIKQMRQILDSMTEGNNLHLKSDEELLKLDLSLDLGLDSLDYEEMLFEISNRYGITIDVSVISQINKNPTVEGFINACNNYLKECEEESV